MADTSTKITIKVDSQTATSNLAKLAQEFQKLSDSFRKPIGEIKAFAELKKSLIENQRAFADAQKRVGELAREIKASATPSRELTAAFEKAKQTAGGLKDTISKQREELHRLKQSMQASGVDASKLASEQLRLKNALKEANAEFQKSKAVAASRDALGLMPHQQVRDEINRLKEAYKTLAASGKLSMSELAQAKIQLKQKIGELKESTNGWAAQIDNARMAFAGIIAASAGFVASIQASKDLQTAMTGVAKVVDAPDSKIESLKNNFLELSRIMPFAARELAQIAQAGGQMGIAADDIKAFVEMTAKIGTAFNMSSEEAGTAVGKLMNIFKMTVPEVEGLADVINTLGNNTNAVEKDIANVLIRIGGAGQIFGLTARETSALAAAFLSLGRPPEVAATAINAFLTKLQTAEVGTGSFQTGLSMLGIQAKDLARDIKEHPQDALMRFLETLKDLDRQSQANVITKIFGMEYQDDIGILLTGLDMYKRILALIVSESETAGAVNKEFERGMATLDNQLKLTKNALNELAIVLGDKFLDSVTVVVDAFKSFVNIIADFAKTYPAISALVTLFVSLGASFSALAVMGRVSWLLFAKSIEAVTVAVGGVVAAMRAMAGLSMANLFISLSGAVTGAKAAIMALNVVLRVGLIGGATLAAMALLYLLDIMKDLEEAREKIREAEEGEAFADEKGSKRAQEIGKQLGLQIGSMKEFNQQVKDGKVYFDEQTNSWQKATQVLNKQTKQMELTEEELKKLEGTIDGVSESYADFINKTASRYDFLADKAKAYASDERQAFQASLNIQRQKMETVLQIAQEEAARKESILFSSGASEQQQAELSKKIAEDLKNFRIKTLEDWQSKLQSAYLNALSQEQSYAAEVKRIKDELRDNERSMADQVRELQRTTMNAEKAWFDRRKQAYETLRESQRALATAEGPDQLKAAVELARDAQNQFKGLAGEVKEGDRVIVSQAKTVSEAIKGMKQANDVVTQGLKGQQSAAEAMQKTWQATMHDIQKDLQSIATEIEELNNTTISPKAEIRVDSSEVDRKLAQLDGAVTTSQHIIYVQRVETNQLGGEIQRFSKGGWNRLFGKLPGWGGGDRIRALLEAGEYIIRKEAVRKYGAGLFEALNSMRLSLPKMVTLPMPEVPAIPKMAYAGGGMVAGADYGTLRLQAGDMELPVMVQGSGGRQMVRDFERELKKLRLTRGH